MAANAIYSNIQRNIKQAQDDLLRLESNDNYPGLQGQISVSLNFIRKSTDEIEDLAKREITTVKREKLSDRATKAREDYMTLKTRFEKVKSEIQAKQQAQERHSLFDGDGSRDNSNNNSNIKHRNNPPTSTTTDSALYQMEQMMREGNTLNNASDRLDDYINMGRTALNELAEQRGILKGTQRRLLDIANSLGMSTKVIRFIEQRTSQDRWILLFGTIISVIIMWAIVHYLT